MIINRFSVFGIILFGCFPAQAQFIGGSGDGVTSIVTNPVIIGITSMYKGALGDGFSKVSVNSQSLGLAAMVASARSASLAPLNNNDKHEINAATYVYPNPSADQFKIHTDSKDVTIILYDIMGQPILEQRVSSETPVNVSGIPSGSYYLRISGGVTTTTKVIIVH